MRCASMRLGRLAVAAAALPAMSGLGQVSTGALLMILIIIIIIYEFLVRLLQFEHIGALHESNESHHR